MRRGWLLLTQFLFSFLVATFMAGVVVIGLLWWSGQWLSQQLAAVSGQFQQAAGRHPLGLLGPSVWGYWEGYRQPLTNYRVLLLGTDEVTGSGRAAILTDTMMIISVQPQAGVVKILPIPRDIFHQQWGTKINSLYAYGHEHYPQQPEKFAANIIGDMTDVPLDSVIVVRLEDVRSLVELLGGLWIDIPQGFVDEQFPRSGVDVTRERDPAVLYERVEFQPGWQRLSGEQVLQYIRSRHSQQAAEAGDDARRARQERVIKALVDQILSPAVMSNPRQLGLLYRWYEERYAEQVSLFTLGTVAGAWQAAGHPPLALQSLSWPLTDQARATDAATLFVHPPVSKYSQWVYEPRDMSWAAVRAWSAAQGL